MAVGKDTSTTRVTSLKYIVDSVANATSESNVTGGAPTIYQIQVDNTNSASACYTKIYDSAGPTVGTTAPNIIVRTNAAKKRTIQFIRHDAAGGITMQTGLSTATVTTAGTAGTTDPTTTPIVRIAAV